MGAQNRSPVPEKAEELVRLTARACDLPIGDLLALDEQLHGAVVTNEGPTMIDVEVPRDAPRLAVGDGPLPLRAFVLSELGEATGEVLVWLKDGRIQFQ